MQRNRDLEQSGRTSYATEGVTANHRRGSRHCLSRANMLLVLFGLAFLLLSACTGRGVFKPKSSSRNTPGADFTSAPVPVTLPVLASNPETFRNRPIRVSGLFTLTESVVCTAHQRGPSSPWSLVAEEWQLNIVGMDELTFRLTEGTSLTLDGIFQRYSGPVGCGKGAPDDTIWFLHIMQIVQPNPIPLVNGLELPRTVGLNTDLLDPTSAPTSTDVTGSVPGDPTATIASPQQTPTPIITPAPTAVETTPTATALTPEPTEPISATATATPTATPATPTATSDELEPTPTSAPGVTPTPVPPPATSTPGGYPPKVTPTPSGYP